MNTRGIAYHGDASRNIFYVTTARSQSWHFPASPRPASPGLRCCNQSCVHWPAGGRKTHSCSLPLSSALQGKSLLVKSTVLLLIQPAPYTTIRTAQYCPWSQPAHDIHVRRRLAYDARFLPGCVWQGFRLPVPARPAAWPGCRTGDALRLCGQTPD
jgi:hypothetical protein